MASLRREAKVIHGEMKASLLDGDSTNYDLDHGFTRHPIDENHGQGIVIELGMPSIINSIRMLLWDRDMRFVCMLRCQFLPQLFSSVSHFHLHFIMKDVCDSYLNIFFFFKILFFRSLFLFSDHLTCLIVFHISRSYSYYIEASLDFKDWVELVDHRKYLCRSWQNLSFPARVVK